MITISQCRTLPRSIILFALYGSILGCAVSIRLPSSRLDSSEVGGTCCRIAIEPRYEGGNEVVLTEDFTLNGPNTSTPAIGRFARVGLSLGLHGLGPIDIELKSPLNMLKIKYQFFGEPRSTAKVGNFSLAVTAGGGLASQTHSGSPFLSQGETRSLTVSEKLGDAALIAGYRPLGFLLVYGGVFASSSSFSGKYDIITSSTKSTSYSSSAESIGANLGVDLGNEKSQIRGEVSYSKTSSGQSSAANWFGGVSLSFGFGG